MRPKPKLKRQKLETIQYLIAIYKSGKQHTIWQLFPVQPPQISQEFANIYSNQQTSYIWDKKVTHWERAESFDLEAPKFMERLDLSTKINGTIRIIHV